MNQEPMRNENNVPQASQPLMKQNQNGNGHFEQNPNARNQNLANRMNGNQHPVAQQPIQAPPTNSFMACLNLFKKDLNDMSDEIKLMLPKEVSLDVFKRVVVTAIQENPDLIMKVVDKESLISACLKCAKDGLLPDGKEAAFILMKGVVVYMPMVHGVKKRLFKYGDVVKMTAHCWYANDIFKYSLGMNEQIIHEPALSSNRGDMQGVYAIFWLRNGEVLLEVMSFIEIEKARLAGKASELSFWKTWYSEMAKKTVIHRLSKNVDMSIDIFENDNIMSHNIPSSLQNQKQIEHEPINKTPQAG